MDKQTILEMLSRMVSDCERGVELNDRIASDETLKWYFEGRKSAFELAKEWIEDLDK